jgi:probable rRNA maturation factor
VRVAAAARIPLRPAGVAALARAVLRAERAGLAALSVAFVGRARIRRLHRDHLGHDRATDVIAFSLAGGTVGDVYVCPAVAAGGARRAGTTLRAELRRLVVHGVLHVLGYDHPDGAERTGSPMWRRQERYLRRFGALAR